MRARIHRLLAQRFGRIAVPDNPLLRFPGWTLRGISQVVFQNNILTGAAILGGIFYNSGAYGFACLLGAVTATLTALFLGRTAPWSWRGGLHHPAPCYVH